MEEKTTWEEVDPKILPKPWKIENFSKEELSKLEEFKLEIKDYLKETSFDLDLLRWLVARDWDVVAATKMFTDSQKWRARVRADSILEDFPHSPYFNFLCKYYPSSNADPNPIKPKIRTKDGQMFLYEKITSVDPSMVNGIIPMEEIYRYHIWCMEKMMKEVYECYVETGNYAPLTVLEDLEGAGMHHMDKKILRALSDIAKIDSDNYPETLRKVILINVPSVFSYMWPVLNYFWDEKQKAKFFFSAKGSDYQSELVQIVHPSGHLKSYGGQCEYSIPDQLINLKLIKDEIPEEKEKTWEKATVDAGTNYQKKISVKNSDSFITWQYKTKDYDIGFGVKYQESSNHPEVEIFPIERIESFKSICHGSHIAQKEGIYILHWDNVYSWRQSKELKYTISVVGKDGDTIYDTEKEKKEKKEKDKKESPYRRNNLLKRRDKQEKQEQQVGE